MGKRSAVLCAASRLATSQTGLVLVPTDGSEPLLLTRTGST